MRQLLLSLFALTFLLNYSLTAQSDSVRYTKQFQFHFVNGYSVSYLTTLPSTNLLRFKIDLGLGGSSRTLDEEEKYYNSLSSTDYYAISKKKADNSSNQQYINIVVNYMWRPLITKGVNLYLGVGPLFSFSKYYNNNIVENISPSTNPSDISSNVSKTTFYGIGIQGVIGIDCSITEKLSLLGEFNLDGTYGWEFSETKWEDQIIPNKRVSNGNGNSWNYGLNSLKVGIAFHF
jgi:hypothetical protein